MALLFTISYLVVQVKLWYGVTLSPICVWDSYLHMLLPIILMLILGYLGTKERLLKDERMKNEFDDMKKVLGNLPQGVALTVDFPTMSRQTYQEKGVSSRIKAVNELINNAEDTDDLEIAL